MPTVTTRYFFVLVTAISSLFILGTGLYLIWHQPSVEGGYDDLLPLQNVARVGYAKVIHAWSAWIVLLASLVVATISLVATAVVWKEASWGRKLSVVSLLAIVVFVALEMNGGRQIGVQSDGNAERSINSRSVPLLGAVDPAYEVYEAERIASVRAAEGRMIWARVWHYIVIPSAILALCAFAVWVSKVAPAAAA